jgi:hypothetical protein
MAGREPEHLQIAFEDVWDWAYCPMRVWWRKTGLAQDVVGIERRRTGEQLVRRSVAISLDTYYRLRADAKRRDITLATALGLVWKTWLDGWGFGREFSEVLVEYQQSRRRLLQRFEARGDIRRPDGTLYQRPMWTRWWRELANSTGLEALRESIDRQGEAAGLAQLEVPKTGAYQSPMGFADAFATSVDIVDRMKDLPAPEKVLGTGVELAVELLSVRLLCRADLVVDLGATRARGRPRKDASGPRMKRKLQYELHMYDQDVPAPFAVSKDLRVLAMGQALPVALTLDAEDVKVEKVLLRHMRTGESQTFRPGVSDGADVLDSIARSVLTGIRRGTYIPRMVCGWRACGDCEYRTLCFSDMGVMTAYNPPMMAQIKASQKMYRQVSRFLKEGTKCGNGIGLLRSFLEWMAKTPGLSPEGASWLIDAVEAGSIH